MQEEANNLTSQALEQAKPLTMCSPMLVRGMTDEEAQAFDGSYRRAKRVLTKINEISRQEYLRILKQEEDVQALNVPNYGEYQAYKLGQRQVWNKIQELTRT